jgi:ribose-phosphate pyrophosphokinase
VILTFEENEPAAQRLAQQLGLQCARILVHRFPDGESKITLPAKLPAEAVLFCSLNAPNTKLVELMLAAGAARELGASRLTLVAPYLCYMRQDTAFHPGEAVSQRIVGRFLANLFDAVITVDAHLHRTATLVQAVPAKQAINLSAAPLLGQFFAAHKPCDFVLGPDAESAQWVAQAAHAAGLPWAVCEKQRFGDHQVAVKLPAASLQGLHIALVDDMVSTGNSLIETAKLCVTAGAASVCAIVTHALHNKACSDRMQDAGITQFWSTDSVPHVSNAIELTPLLAEAVRSLMVH